MMPPRNAYTQTRKTGSEPTASTTRPSTTLPIPLPRSTLVMGEDDCGGVRCADECAIMSSDDEDEEQVAHESPPTRSPRSPMPIIEEEDDTFIVEGGATAIPLPKSKSPPSTTASSPRSALSLTRPALLTPPPSPMSTPPSSTYNSPNRSPNIFPIQAPKPVPEGFLRLFAGLPEEHYTPSGGKKLFANPTSYHGNSDSLFWKDAPPILGRNELSGGETYQRMLARSLRRRGSSVSTTDEDEGIVKGFVGEETRWRRAHGLPATAKRVPLTRSQSEPVPERMLLPPPAPPRPTSLRSTRSSRPRSTRSSLAPSPMSVQLTEKDIERQNLYHNNASWWSRSKLAVKEWLDPHLYAGKSPFFRPTDSPASPASPPPPSSDS